MARVVVTRPAAKVGTVRAEAATDPIRIPDRLFSITMTYVIPQADRDLPDASIHQVIEVSTDNGVTWSNIMDGGVWVSGTGRVDGRGVRNPGPAMTLAGPGLAAFAGHFVRGALDVPRAITIETTVVLESRDGN